MNFPIIKKTNKLERIFILAALLILGLIIGSVIGVIYPLVSGQDVMSLNSLRFMQISSQIFTFVLPPIIYAMLIKENPKESLGIKNVSYHWFIIGFVMMYAILPLNNVFAEWNAGLKLPESMSRIEELIKEMYESSAVVLDKLVNVNTFGGFVINLIMIAGLAALGEELLFRSIIQTSLIKTCKNAHVGIIIASAIFSFIHFDFYAFIPRLVLGMLLGYMFYYSRSIWVSMFMHFVNNATAVVIYYLNNIGVTNVDVETFGQTQLLPLLISIALMAVLFWLAIKRMKNVQ
ncbi:MAG: CPBP family intramembrane metalloprotease [Bacteroidales bacterium]|nr:CPBP family intramembrane metalloprotease [Bacteroidales bacterium]